MQSAFTKEKMIVQEWKVKCSYRANVIISGEVSEHLNKKSLHPAIKTIEFSNNRTEEGKYTGKFDLIIVYAIEIEENIESINDNKSYARDLGFDLLSIYVNLISFYTGKKIEKIGTVSIEHKIDDNKTTHIIEGIIEKTDSPVIELNINTLIDQEMDSKLNRVISFYVYGQSESNPLNCFILLMSGLDMLSGVFQYDSLERKNRVCKKCYHKEKLELSTSQKVRYLLIKYSGCSEDKAKKIWDDRSTISHGAFYANSKSLRELRDNITQVRITIVKAIKEILEIESNQLPNENFFGISNAYLSLDLNDAV